MHASTFSEILGPAIVWTLGWAFITVILYVGFRIAQPADRTSTGYTWCAAVIAVALTALIAWMAGSW